ncbi:hypothetical protein BVRB_4g087430 [Beta vulgaris subsp. vulgaris]|nr:hypothetical protein BVRB_4g087430 [Beta vulgaris subsp. vulgaris]
MTNSVKVTPYDLKLKNNEGKLKKNKWRFEGQQFEEEQEVRCASAGRSVVPGPAVGDVVRLCSHCGRTGHVKECCYRLIGWPDRKGGRGGGSSRGGRGGLSGARGAFAGNTGNSTRDTSSEDELYRAIGPTLTDVDDNKLWVLLKLCYLIYHLLFYHKQKCCVSYWPEICDVGDIESMSFIESLGQFSYRVGPGNFYLIHVSLVLVLNVVGEQPTLHSVRGLQGLGLTPDILACRSTLPFDENVKANLSQFCHVPVLKGRRSASRRARKTDYKSLKDYTGLFCTSSKGFIMLVSEIEKDQKAHGAILKVLHLYGAAKEPMLDEWTRRAQLCAMLYKLVRFHGWKVHGTFRFLSICTKDGV